MKRNKYDTHNKLIKIMRIPVIKQTLFQILLFCFGLTLFVSCNGERKSKTGNEMNSEVKNENEFDIGIDKQLLVGSWKDTSESALHFTLFKDGSARSNNMKTLLYKNWRVNGRQITFTIESVGNGMSSTNEVTYTIDKLSKDKMVLRKGDYLSEYTKD